ncbi:unnamed protein product [Prorocentrum cordatum]|uniref:Uncharacterized protein n=1 Tax=Prorocentrum cordatum TaxID=2364126 RepID=A0ABN9WB36_9DINO|nr:unnamed protein product [Polarella glacialis]
MVMGAPGAVLRPSRSPVLAAEADPVQVAGQAVAAPRVSDRVDQAVLPPEPAGLCSGSPATGAVGTRLGTRAAAPRGRQLLRGARAPRGPWCPCGCPAGCSAAAACAAAAGAAAGASRAGCSAGLPCRSRAGRSALRLRLGPEGRR